MYKNAGGAHLDLIVSLFVIGRLDELKLYRWRLSWLVIEPFECPLVALGV